MAAVYEKGSAVASTIRLQLLLNYCRTVVRCEDTQLKSAMQDYACALAVQPGQG